LSAGGLKPISVRDYSSRFSAMLARAVELDLLVKNPCSAAKLPRIPRRDLPILTGPEMRVLLKAAAGDRLEALLVVALTTGIRQGETLALQWDRVDLDEGVLSITKTLKAVPGDGFTLVEPKTSSAVRKVVLAPMAVDALRRHRIRQSEEALALGKAWDNQYRLVFSNEVGGFISQSNLVSRHFKKWLATAGLPRTVRWHDLRHTAASILLSKGVPVPTVSQMLGHADPSITLKTYSWAVPGDQALAATAMESLLAG